MIESDAVLGVVKVGKGSAKVVGYWHDPLYERAHAKLGDSLPPAEMGIVYLDSLTNGGEKGTGEAVVRKAVQQVGEMGYRLVIIPKSGKPGGQQKLVEWYASLGMLTQIPGTDWFYA